MKSKGWMARLSLSVVLLLSACTSTREEVLEDGVYEGFYLSAFERNEFRLCNSHEVWWVTPVPALASDMETLYESLIKPAREIIGGEKIGRLPRKVFVRFHGVPSERGAYGHLDSYEREFYLDRIIEVRVVRRGDCR